MALKTEQRGGALILTIDRPDAGNALNSEVGRGLVGALSSAADDPAVRSIIVTGAGERVFCAGMDLKAFAAGEDMTLVGEGLAILSACPKPITLNPAGSRRPIVKRVRLLPASNPTA